MLTFRNKIHFTENKLLNSLARTALIQEYNNDARGSQKSYFYDYKVINVYVVIDYSKCKKPEI